MKGRAVKVCTKAGIRIAIIVLRILTTFNSSAFQTQFLSTIAGEVKMLGLWL